ncbi:Paramyosin_ long formlike, partial [Caligus rogercresseyi]
MALALSARSKADDSEMMSSMKRTTKTYTYKQDGSGNITRECHTKVDCGEDASIKAMRRFEEQIRVLQDDYESEQHLRRRVEREKQDLQMQILSLTERLTQAEGGAECQLDINRKREAEMAHLRKLLEEVHSESEHNIHELKKRHQQAMMELQEQIESVARSKDKVSKEKSKLQVEIESLLAQMEVFSSEKTTVRKTIERLEVQINEHNCKIDVMCKELTAVTSERNSLKLSNDESNRKLNDMKIAIESAGLDKNKVASQLLSAESRIVALETQLKSLSVEIHDYKETRIELEKQLSHFKNDGLDWKKKYENEARMRIEDVDTLRKKFGAQVADLQDQLDAVLSKLKAMEQAKNRLQMEVQTLIKDLEISQSTVKEFQSKLNISEKRSEDLAIKLREMTNMYEKADNEVKARGQELIRLSNDMDRLKMDNGVLLKDRSKLEDECRMLKAELDSIKRQLHAAEQENRKLGHDREELARAFKDADAEEAPWRQPKLFLQKDDEFNATKKKLMVEIESLTARLHDTENRLKNEVEKIKKKMAVTITELEMSLDSANKSNVNFQNVNKTQATQIMELTSMYDSACKKLDVTVGDASALNKKVSIVETELQSLRSAHGGLDNARR